jgi:predicted MFS family arabinose efflux permease
VTLPIGSQRVLRDQTGITSPVTRGEVAGIAVLSLGFGLVGIDRFLIATMYPTIARDLHLDYRDIGTITGALAIAWGVAALIMGNLSDHVGRRRVLVCSLIAFSLLIGASGLATGLAGLVVVRIVMGFADGAFAPASISAAIEMSPPERHGRNVGFQQTMMVLFGLGLSPLLVGALLRGGISWRLIFSLFLIPGLVVAWLTWRLVPGTTVNRGKFGLKTSLADWRQALRYKNIRLLMAGMFCWLTCLITTSAFLPSYLTNYLGLGGGQMAVVMSAIGFGAMGGTIILPAISDLIGRKPVMVISSIGTLMALISLSIVAQQTSYLFASLFMVHFFNNALITLTVGPIAAETVPSSLMATASGVVIATGELLGGGLAPIIGGQVAHRFGIEHILRLPQLMMAVGVLLCLALRETRLRRARSIEPPTGE